MTVIFLAPTSQVCNLQEETGAYDGGLEDHRMLFILNANKQSRNLSKQQPLSEGERDDIKKSH
jgi:hypothetical protein